MTRELLPEQVAIFNEWAGGLECDLAVRDPVIEVRHQFLLVGDRQQSWIFNPLRQTFVKLAIVERIGACIGHYLGKAFALPLLYRGRPLLSHLADIAQPPQNVLAHARTS